MSKPTADIEMSGDVSPEGVSQAMLASAYHGFREEREVETEAASDEELTSERIVWHEVAIHFRPPKPIGCGLALCRRRVIAPGWAESHLDTRLREWSLLLWEGPLLHLVAGGAKWIATWHDYRANYGRLPQVLKRERARLRVLGTRPEASTHPSDIS